MYQPLRGNSYIPLPDKLKNKKAIINPRNKDNECFKWCITRALNPVERDAERITKILRRQSENFNWSDIDFPVSLSEIGKFERRNEGIHVNVFGYEKSEICPLRNTKKKKSNRPVAYFRW